MVLLSLRLFENDVEMYGAQARGKSRKRKKAFENDVEMYGAQACPNCIQMKMEFENDVEMYGAQANVRLVTVGGSLRMM